MDEVEQEVSEQSWALSEAEVEAAEADSAPTPPLLPPQVLKVRGTHINALADTLQLPSSNSHQHCIG